MSPFLKRFSYSCSRRAFLDHCRKFVLGFSAFLTVKTKPALGIESSQGPIKEDPMKLPAPQVTQVNRTVALEAAIQNRRTIRSFSPRKLSLQMLAQILWAAQGITDPNGYKRAAPSAGALYPLDIYAVIGAEAVEQTPAGVFHFQPADHALVPVTTGDLRQSVAQWALGQTWMAKAPVMMVITAEYRRITGKYGERGIRYAHMESGHIAQNIFLQAEALGLSAGIVGAFNDKELQQTMKISDRHEPLLIMPVGYKN